jgi:hypothetical protein
MSRPSREELAIALAEAGRMREQGEDPHYLAKSLLNHNYRLKMLEDLHAQIKYYLHAGQSGLEHSKLTAMLDKLDAEERHPGLNKH